MRYSENIDYLVPVIMYLGTDRYDWSGTPRELAEELSIDATRLAKVLDAFPALFRRLETRHEDGQIYYALHSRYALNTRYIAEGVNLDGARETHEVLEVRPLDSEKLEFLLNFVLKMADSETMVMTNRRTNVFAIIAVVVSAAALIVAALLKH
jgi:hypothetical protein